MNLKLATDYLNVLAQVFGACDS